MKTSSYWCGVCGSGKTGSDKDGFSCHGDHAHSHELTPMVKIGSGKKGKQRLEQLETQHATHVQLFHKSK